jgi:hypothetical protein
MFPQFDRPIAEQRFGRRSETGSLSVLIPLFILMAIIGIGAFGMDVSHNVTVRTELQGATDAAALAGAQSLLHPSTENNAFSDALNVASSNSADGKLVSNSNPSFTVQPTQGTWDNSTNSCQFSVRATKTIKNMWSKLFGHHSDTIRTRSTAQCWRSIVSVDKDMMFPLAVSIDTTQGHDHPLYKSQIGDIVKFEINSQQWKNAAFTTFNITNPNANTLTHLVDQNLGFLPYDGTIPPMQIGDQLSMTNGVAEQKNLAKGEYLQGMIDPNRTLIIPVMSGEPPYNSSRKIVGFMAVKIKNIRINNRGGGEVETIEAQIVRFATKGLGGVPHGSNNEIDQGMRDISAGTFKLVS